MKKTNTELTISVDAEELTPLDYPTDEITAIPNTDEVDKACDNVDNPSPPDGGWGWICVGARFVSVFICFGVVYSFGVIYVELVDVFSATRAEVAWVGSVASGAMHMAGPLSSLLNEQYGFRVTTIIAGGVAAVGFLVSAFAPSLFFLYFSFGVVGGAHQRRRRPSCVSFHSLFAVMNHRPFLIFLAATAATHLGVMVPYVHLPDLARLTGVAKGDASFLVSIMGFVGILGRLLFGYIADFRCVSRILFYAVMLLICGAGTLLCTMVKTYTLFAVYAAVQGAFIGTWTAFTPIVLTDIVGVQHTGNALGLTIFLSGISITVASPIAGSLFDFTGRYVASFYLAASIYLLGGLLNIACYLYIKLKHDKGIDSLPTYVLDVQAT
ncbi:monocarboxylate transporter 9-like isoform X3 [Haliotis rubra]|uniref:monocarboxylate transporter 9-like isoform X3 n=1 Tax=Haliotis rubra TaxID=36100 RepID=UPI001EE50F68|nr:monocarboxylate transporter 9-like isoform X3 [Haliotis rubra]